MLIPSLVKGRIFTFDAMHTQRALCAQIHRLAGEYVLIAKDNQPTLNEDIADLFEDRTPDRRRWKQAETWDKGHGRLEHRQITCSPDLNDWFSKQWEDIEQVFRLERTVRLLTTGKLRHEVVYGLSSLSIPQAPPPRLLHLYWLRSMSVPKPERNQSCWKSFRQLLVTYMPKKGTERAIIDALFEKDILRSQYR